MTSFRTALAMVLLTGAAGAVLSSPARAANSDEYGGAFACPGRGVAGTALAYMPVPSPSLLNGGPSVRHRLVLSNGGTMKFDGRPATLAQLPGLLVKATAGPRSEVTVQPGKLTPFGEVVRAVAAINTLRFCNFGFIGNEQWGSAAFFSRSDTVASRLAAPKPPSFTKASDAVITLGYGPVGTATGPGGKYSCRMLFNTKPTDFNESLKLSYRNLDSGIKRMGGIEAVKQAQVERGPTALPVTIIQAKASLPWHCAAGAAYTAQISGYPVIDLVILPG